MPEAESPSGPDPSDHGSVETRSPPTLQQSPGCFKASRLPSHPHPTAHTPAQRRKGRRKEAHEERGKRRSKEKP